MPNRDNFNQVRKEYDKGELNEVSIPSDPFQLFQNWYQDALDVKVVEPNAFSLATTFGNKPSVRFVLLKGVMEGKLLFYTNYESRKGRELLINPFASGAFYWKELERQVRFEGQVEKISRNETIRYFNSRPREARLSVLVSKQSETIPSREYLENLLEEAKKKYEDTIPCPEYWGGYQINVTQFEFWQGRVGRLHDRILYVKRENDTWSRNRLSP